MCVEPMQTRPSYEGTVTAWGIRRSLSLGETDVLALQDRCCVRGFNASDNRYVIDEC